MGYKVEEVGWEEWKEGRWERTSEESSRCGGERRQLWRLRRGRGTRVWVASRLSRRSWMLVYELEEGYVQLGSRRPRESNEEEKRAPKLMTLPSFLLHQIRETLKTVDIDSSGRVELEDWVAVCIVYLLSKPGEHEGERAHLPSKLEVDLDFASFLPSSPSLLPTTSLDVSLYSNSSSLLFVKPPTLLLFSLAREERSPSRDQPDRTLSTRWPTTRGAVSPTISTG